LSGRVAIASDGEREELRREVARGIAVERKKLRGPLLWAQPVGTIYCGMPNPCGITLDEASIRWARPLKGCPIRDRSAWASIDCYYAKCPEFYPDAFS
jgi:hypothetical protein